MHCDARPLFCPLNEGFAAYSRCEFGEVFQNIVLPRTKIHTEYSTNVQNTGIRLEGNKRISCNVSKYDKKACVFQTRGVELCYVRFLLTFSLLRVLAYVNYTQRSEEDVSKNKRFQAVIREVRALATDKVN